MKRIEVEPGTKFGRLTVIEEAPVRISTAGNRSRYFICRCECGNTKEYHLNHLRRGKTLSCSCQRKEKVAAALTKHGHKTANNPSRAYIVWTHIKGRCHNSKDAAYAKYGGRGIYVCDRWLESFENFLEDMGLPPSGMTLERIDNNKGYSPENCKWATLKEQGRNKRNNRLITYQGETKPLSEWVEILGLDYARTRKRINLGWTAEKAFNKPTQGKKGHVR